MDWLNQVMVFCGYVTTVGGALTIAYKGYKASKRPCAVNEAKIEEHSSEIKSLQEKSDRDYKAITEMKEMQAAQSQALIALMDHEITGNHIDGLKKTKADLIRHITTMGN